MKGWYQEQQEMERSANTVIRGCGLLTLVVALVIAGLLIIISIL